MTSALADGSAGTLGALLADPSCATITFAADMTIPGQLQISRNVTIDGAGRQVAISGDTNGDGTPEQESGPGGGLDRRAGL